MLMTMLLLLRLWRLSMSKLKDRAQEVTTNAILSKMALETSISRLTESAITVLRELLQTGGTLLIISLARATTQDQEELLLLTVVSRMLLRTPKVLEVLQERALLTGMSTSTERSTALEANGSLLESEDQTQDMRLVEA